MMEVVVTTGAKICANLQSAVTTNKPTPNFLQAGHLSSRHPTNSVKALKEKVITFHRTAHSKLT